MTERLCNRSRAVVVGGCSLVFGIGFGCTDGRLQVWVERGEETQPTHTTGGSGAGVTDESANPSGGADAVSSRGGGSSRSVESVGETGANPDAGGVDPAASQTPALPSGSGLTGTASSDPSVEPLLVDDFEDGDTKAASGLGWWYTQSDTTGQQSFRIESSGDGLAGGFSAHYTGSGFQVWGALLGLDFTPGEGEIDARAYETLHFRARLGDGSVSQISARLLDPSGQYSMDIELSTEWRSYTLSFSELRAVDGGEQRLDPSRLTQLHVFIFSAEYFDLWLDDFVLR